MGRLFGARNKASAKGGKRTGGKRSASFFTKNSAKTAKKLQTLQTLVQTVQHEVDSGSTHLYAAARRGDGARVQELIEAGSSVNEATTSGRTPLHVAAQNGHLTVVMKPTKRTKMHNSLTEAEISAIVDADAGIYFGDEVWPGDEEDQMPELMSQSSDDDDEVTIAPALSGNPLPVRMTLRERILHESLHVAAQNGHLTVVMKPTKRTEAEISAIIAAELARLEAGAYSSSDEDDERYWYRDEDNEAPPTKLRKRRKLHDSASASHDGACNESCTTASCPRTAGVYCAASLQALRAKIEVQIAQHSTKGK